MNFFLSLHSYKHEYTKTNNVSLKFDTHKLILEVNCLEENIALVQYMYL